MEGPGGATQKCPKPFIVLTLSPLHCMSPSKNSPGTSVGENKYFVNLTSVQNQVLSPNFGWL